MPTAIDPRAPARRSRRACLTLLAAAPLAAFAGDPAPPNAATAAPRPARPGHAHRAAFFAAWDDAAGGHHVGRIGRRPGADGWRIEAALDVPTRAHGLVALPDGSLLAVARRPGDWLLRWHPDHPADAAAWRWTEPDRSYAGHALAFGAFVYTSETDHASGAGLLVQRDAASFERLAEWPTHGIDPHALLPDGPDAILVANGGIPTLPETGRAKRALASMDSSLARLDAANGELRAAWRLADRRQSLRHLARHGTTLGVALQAQHDDPAERDAAPVLALLAGDALRAVDGPRRSAGYGGDIGAGPAGFFVSCPRIDAVAHWSPGGRWLGLTPHAEACALITIDGAPWAAGPRGLRRLEPASAAAHAWPVALAPDNHAVACTAA